MRRIKFLILMTLVSLCVGVIYAQTANTEKKIPEVRKIPLAKRNLPSCPKAPSAQSVECLYDGENLYIEFTLPEGECELEIQDLENMSYHTFDSSVMNVISVGRLTEGTLYLTTESGQSYQGDYYFIE